MIGILINIYIKDCIIATRVSNMIKQKKIKNHKKIRFIKRLVHPDF